MGQIPSDFSFHKKNMIFNALMQDSWTEKKHFNIAGMYPMTKINDKDKSQPNKMTIMLLI